MNYLTFLIKLISSCLFIFFAVKNIDFSQTARILYSMHGLQVLGVTTLIVLIQTVIAGLKLIPILEIFNYSIRVFDAIKLWFVGNFFSQFMISFLGGDVVRIVSLTRSGIHAKEAGSSILLDRILGFVALHILYLIAVCFLLNYTSVGAAYDGLLILAGIGLVMIVGFVSMGFVPQRFIAVRYIGKIVYFASISKYLLRSKSKSIYVLLMSAMIHLLSVLAIYFIAFVLGGQITIFDAFIVGIPVMLISMLPISVGGWGLRENSMIIGFGFIGISSEIALSTSIIFGLSLLIGSLPGALAFWGKTEYTTGLVSS